MNQRFTRKPGASHLQLVVNNEQPVRRDDSPPPDWASALVEELRTTTRNGAEGSSIFTSIKSLPSEQELNSAKAFLDSRGIKVELNPYENDDGTVSAWVSYFRDL